MLPDFPSSKRDIDQLIRLRLQRSIRQRSVLAGLAASIVQHEGELMAYDQLTKEGKRTLTGEYEKAEAGVTISLEEIPTLTGENLYKKLDQLAEDIARQTSQTGFRRLEETLANAGTGVDAGGQPLTPELYMQSLEAMEINFNPDTLEPTFVLIIHPAMRPSLEKVKDLMENDPEYKGKYEALMARKLEDWRDRESRRKLVD